MPVLTAVDGVDMGDDAPAANPALEDAPTGPGLLAGVADDGRVLTGGCRKERYVALERALEPRVAVSVPAVASVGCERAARVRCIEAAIVTEAIPGQAAGVVVGVTACAPAGHVVRSAVEEAPLLAQVVHFRARPGTAERVSVGGAQHVVRGRLTAVDEARDHRAPVGGVDGADAELGEDAGGAVEGADLDDLGHGRGRGISLVVVGPSVAVVVVPRQLDRTPLEDHVPVGAEVTRYGYRDGFYDGVEKQYRASSGWSR